MPRSITYANAHSSPAFPAVQIEVDEVAVAKVAADFPEYADMLDSAMKVWTVDKVPVRILCDGVKGGPGNVTIPEPADCGCCLFGAARVGRTWSPFDERERERMPNGVELDWSLRERFGVAEVGCIRTGFDGGSLGSNPSEIEQRTYAFGRAVRLALKIPVADKLY